MADSNKQTNEARWRIIVVGAEDVAQHLRKVGHRVLALEQVPARGFQGADAAVVEIGGTIDARSAARFRSRLVEPILIHQRRTERARAFLCLQRRTTGELNLDLLTEALGHVVERTMLLRRTVADEQCNVDAPTERVTQELCLVDVQRRARTAITRRRDLVEAV